MIWEPGTVEMEKWGRIICCLTSIGTMTVITIENERKEKLINDNQQLSMIINDISCITYSY
ncbi:Uncharacterized protein dnl_00040 [Desulfonema limicola]|nr:hypothetical protein [Desulfonema limicola]QTA77807.1 Uncharacterized protein dnl_00040 [Desulfonema limicola]